MMRRPTLSLTAGLPCTGKTTAAQRIEIEQKALRLPKDEWVKALYGHENPPSAQDVIEERLIQTGLRPRTRHGSFRERKNRLGGVCWQDYTFAAVLVP